MSEQTKTILVLAEKQGDLHLLQSLLERTFKEGLSTQRFRLTSAGANLPPLERILEAGCDIVLYVIPTLASIDLEKVRSLCLTASGIPLVVVADCYNEVAVLSLFQAGIQDFLVQGQFDGDALARSLWYAQERKGAQRNRSKSEERSRAKRGDPEENQLREKMLEQRNTELVLINNASQAFNSTLDLNQVLSRVLEILTPQLGAAGSFWLLDPGSGDLICREASGPSADSVRNWRLKSGVGIAGWVAKKGESLIVRDVLLDERFSSQVSKSTGFSHRSMISVPLKSKEKVIGVLQVLGTEVGRFDDTNLALIESIASFAAIAVENARLFEESQRAARQAALLNDITQAALKAINLDVMIQTLADRLGDLFSADGVFITFWDEIQKKAVPAAAYSSFSRNYSLIKVEPGEKTLTEACLQFGKVLAVEDFTNTPLISRRIKSQFTLKSLLGLPLISDGRKLGAVLIGYNETHVFTPEEIALGERTAGQVALAFQKVKLLEEIQKLAITDELTGLYNRRGFILLAEQHLKLASRTGEPFGLFFVDMDGLKKINDQHGHQCGDMALIEAAAVIKHTFRLSDLIARIGGDEFCIMVFDIPPKEAQKLIKRFKKKLPIVSNKFLQPFQLSLSIGYAGWNPAYPCSIDDLLVRADAAMYNDKRECYENDWLSCAAEPSNLEHK